MSDAPRLSDSVEQRLGLVARGVQRMADAFVSLEQRFNDLAEAERLQALSERVDEYRVRNRSEVAQIAERLAAIEQVIASLRDELAMDRLETSMRSMGSDLEKVVEDTTGLRADVKKSFERVLFTINSAEESLTGEVRAVDHRLSGMANDVRLVRGLRDSLEALASGVDSVRQLASRSATSSQMVELTRDLSTVLAEIESARSQVLNVDQQVGLVQSGAIDVGPAATDEVTRTVEQLERTVTDELGDLGRRIEELAESVIAQPLAGPESPELTDQITRRLRSLATSARQLGMGMAEDMRSRRGSKRR